VENYFGERFSISVRSHTNAKKVFVGGTRELHWKNLPRVEEAFRRVQEKNSAIAFQLQTSDRAKFLQDIQSSYAVVIASLGDISPNTILEAISFGKPFILTRETGLYEKLKGIGVWVNPEDVDDIATKIEWLADEKNYEEQCKKVAAFTFAHSYKEIADEIFEIYSKLK
jgi:glycosyltransferase involved in cell wall biosynthesis